MSDEQIPTTPQGYIELKPVVQAKYVHQAVRNILANEMYLDQKAFDALVTERVDLYLKNKGVADVVRSAIEKAFNKGSYWSPDKLTAVINKQVEVAIKSLVDETVRATLSDKLKDAVSKII